MRASHEYERGGALAYLAACDVHRARVTGLCSDTTGTGPFTDLAGEVMTQEPWLNQVDLLLDQVQDRLTAFEQRYNATAQPFEWKFTPADLQDLLAWIERDEQKERNRQHEHDHQPAALAAA